MSQKVDIGRIKIPDSSEGYVIRVVDGVAQWRPGGSGSGSVDSAALIGFIQEEYSAYDSNILPDSADNINIGDSNNKIEEIFLGEGGVLINSVRIHQQSGNLYANSEEICAFTPDKISRVIDSAYVDIRTPNRGVQGDSGQPGAPGDTGPAGPQGICVQGVQGLKGIQGLEGPGLSGTTQGTDGLQGVQGFCGDGLQGAQGIQGTCGVQGDRGTPGECGPQGIAATPGAQGIQGICGVQGSDGENGDDGEIGTQGTQGLTGFTGNVQGPQGTQGTQGAQGPQGSVGDDGYRGFDGPVTGSLAQGTQGIQGIENTTQGPQGATGVGTGTTFGLDEFCDVVYQPAVGFGTLQIGLPDTCFASNINSTYCNALLAGCTRRRTSGQSCQVSIIGRGAGNIQAVHEDYVSVGACAGQCAFGFCLAGCTSGNIEVGYSATSSDGACDNITVGASSFNLGGNENFTRNISIGACNQLCGTNGAAGLEDNIVVGTCNKVEYQKRGVYIGECIFGGELFCTNVADDVFIGVEAAGRCCSTRFCSFNNVAIGYRSLFDVRVAACNVALGSLALTDCNINDRARTICFSTGIGAYAGRADIFNGRVCNNNYLGRRIGTTASLCNNFYLGAKGVQSIRANVTTISFLSDCRDKKDIEDIPYGLDFINCMRPISFDWCHRDSIMVGLSDIGFVAQELQALESDQGSSLWTRIVDGTEDRLEASALRTYPIAIKAIQELRKQINNLKEDFQILKADT